MATKFAACAQLFTHDNITATTVASSRTLPSKTNFVLIENMDTTISALVSLDGGVTFKTLKAGKSLSLDCDSLRTLYVKCASSTISVECLYGYEA